MVILVGLAITHFDPAAEHKVLHFLSPPPNGVRWLVTSVYVLGSFGLIVILGSVALLSHRRAILRDLVVAGLAACGLSGLLWLVFGMTGGRPDDASLAGYNLDYPVLIVAATVAVAMAALPYLSRTMQRLVELVIWLAAVATVVAGDGLPVNVAASVALGWGTAALVHLVFGSPLGLPSGEELAVVLDDLGVPVSTHVAGRPPGVGGGPIHRHRRRRRTGGGVALRSRRRRRPVVVQDGPIPLLPGLGADAVVLADPAGRARGLHDPAGRAGRRDHLARPGGRDRWSEPGRRPGRPATTGHPAGGARRVGCTDEVLDALFTTVLDLRRPVSPTGRSAARRSWSIRRGPGSRWSTFERPRRARPRSVWTPTWPAPWPPPGWSPAPSGRPPLPGGSCRRRRSQPRCPICGGPASTGLSRRR